MSESTCGFKSRQPHHFHFARSGKKTVKISDGYARVVELVDSLASGASARKGVRVRLPPRAPKKVLEPHGSKAFFFFNFCTAPFEPGQKGIKKQLKAQLAIEAQHGERNWPRLHPSAR